MQIDPKHIHQKRLRVFLCHASEDKSLVRDIHQKLTASGFAPWLDEFELLPGQNWREEIPAAIRACHAVMVCLSRRSITKEGYLQKEITEALSCAEEKPESTIFIIPACFEEVEVPKRLRQWQWANLYEKNGFDGIVASLKVRAKELGIPLTPTASHLEILQGAVLDLEQAYDLTLEALADALDLRGIHTERHGRRVTGYTIALARSMGMKRDELKSIVRAALLHDIGSMHTPDAILLKPGALSPEETRIVREHCERGHKLLSRIPSLLEVAEIVYAHHEHYDGKGYPRGLRGSEIPIGARIFAIADTLDAITSDRPYRRASSLDVARERIQRCSGTQFDPKVVEAFLRLPNELWQDLKVEIERS